MTVNIDNFVTTLSMALKGMGGIFIVTAFIILVTVLLKAVTKNK